MRHVLIYGPPAAGKLTVARLLAERHGMTLLDNHLTVDVALRLFEFGTRQFGDLVENLRRVLFEAATAAGRDSVSTLVFAHPTDLLYVEGVQAMAARCGAELIRVQLCPPPAVLHERVSTAERRSSNKISDELTLRRVLSENDLYTPVAATDLSIDNSELTPEEVVETIGTHLRG